MGALRAWIAAATALALALRLFGLGADSIWYDESFTWHVTSLPWPEVARAAGDSNCPGYYLLAKAFVGLFGDGEAVLRLPAALLGVATVPLVALLALRMGGGPVGAVVAAFIAALAQALVHFGQEARGYTLLVFASTATLLAFARTRDMGDVRAPAQTRDVIALALSATLLLYAHPFGMLEVAGLGLYLVWRWASDRRFPRPAFLGLAIAGALFAPFVPDLLLAQKRVAERFWIVPMPVEIVVRVPGRLLHWGRGDVFAYAYAALAIVAFARLPRPWRRLTLALAFACWIAPAVHGHFGLPLFESRYAYGLLPLVVAPLGCLVARAARRTRRLGVVLCAVILGGLAADTTKYFATRPHRPEWRTAFAEQRRAREEGAMPVGLSDGTEIVAAYYLRASTQLVPLTKDPDGRPRVGPLPPGRIAIVARPEFRDAILEAAAGRTIVRELPRPHPMDQLFLEIR